MLPGGGLKFYNLLKHLNILTTQSVLGLIVSNTSHSLRGLLNRGTTAVIFFIVIIAEPAGNQEGERRKGFG